MSERRITADNVTTLLKKVLELRTEEKLPQFGGHGEIMFWCQVHKNVYFGLELSPSDVERLEKGDLDDIEPLWLSIAIKENSYYIIFDQELE